MFIILISVLLISSILVLIAKRNKETLYMFAMFISLAILVVGIMIYIAKKGGISSQLQTFYFMNIGIKIYFQYLLITLDNLGFIVAIGRILYPLFVLLLAINYTVLPWLLRRKWIKKYIIMLLVVSLICYYLILFFAYFENNNILYIFTNFWIL